MSSNLDKYKEELNKLHSEGIKLLKDFAANKDNAHLFNAGYQAWYSEALEVVRQLLPNRSEEFQQLYKEDKRKKIDSSTYGIKDWLLGVRAPEELFEGKQFNDYEAAIMRYQSQLSILDSASKRFESSLFEIKHLVQADLFDSEIDVARELNKKGFARGAGAVAGVVLEGHLAQVCDNHNIKIGKKNPGIGDYNQSLKDKSVIEIKDWRFIQRLGDLRNLCDHDKKRNPTGEEIDELLDGVEKITKTVY